MHRSSVLCLVAIVGLGLVARDSATADNPCNELKAVFTYDDVRYIIYGSKNNMIGISLVDDVIVFMGTASDTYDKRKKAVTAAVGLKSQGDFTIFEGKLEMSYRGLTKGGSSRPFSYSTARAMMSQNPKYDGVDAAYSQDRYRAVYFAGCEYAVVESTFSTFIKKGRMFDVGLPCDVDAAWASKDFKVGYISKGHDLYKWRRGAYRVDNKVNLETEIPFFKYLNICP